MKPEGYFANRFELYELEIYARSKETRLKLEEELQEFEESWYEESPMPKVYANPDLGILYVGSGWPSLEDFVLDMIEQKDLFRQRIERLKKQEELFEMAVDTLTPRERDTIQVHYFNRDNDLGLSLEFFTEILEEAQEKLCSYIQHENVKRRSAAVKQQKDEIKQRVEEFKGHRVRIS